VPDGDLSAVPGGDSTSIRRDGPLVESVAAVPSPDLP